MSSVRQPQAVVTLKGYTLACQDVSIHLTRNSKCDTLSATIALYEDPGAEFWSSANVMEIKCKIDNGAGKSANLFDGIVDSVDIDLKSGTVKISARDKVSRMLDKKSSFKHLNKKPHEIVSSYADLAGMPCEFDETSEKAGTNYQIDFAASMHRVSDWHACQKIAEHHGMTAYASCGKIYFKKEPEKVPVFHVNFEKPTANEPGSANVMSFNCKRNVSLGKTTKTKVKSWNHKSQCTYEAEHVEQGGDEIQEFHLHHAGLNQEQANARAKAHSGKALKHEFEIQVEIPGDPTVNARMNLQVSGTKSAFDQLHEITSVEHKISQGSGYTTSISTKTKSKKRGGK